MNRVSFLVSFFFVAVCPMMGQPLEKKMLREENFSQWHTMDVAGISQDGQWVSYSHDYEEGPDTLFVRNIKSGRMHHFPEGKSGKFGRGFFACELPGSQLAITDLVTGRHKGVENILQWEILDEDAFILTVQQAAQDKGKQLCLWDRGGNAADTIAGVTEYALQSKGRSIVYVARNKGAYKLFRYDTRLRLPTLLCSSGQKMYAPSMNKDGAIAFLEDTADGQCSLTLLSDKGRSSILVGREAQQQISGDHGLKVSDDGQKVFFWTMAASAASVAIQETEPQIWSASDSIIYPVRNEIAKYAGGPTLFVWFPALQNIIRITEDSSELVSLSGKQSYAVLAASRYKGQDGMLYGTTDIYITSLRSGARTLLLKGHTADHNMVRLSPLTDALAYYRDGAWWHYDMATQKHSLLAGSAVSQWDNSKSSLASELELYGNPVWSSDGKHIFLFDAFDIWKASPGESPVRLTSGREKGIAFRLEKSIQKYLPDYFQYSEFSAAYLNKEGSLVLHAKGNDSREGYFIYDKKKKEKPLIYGEFLADQLQVSESGRYIARTQSFDRSPALVFTDEVGADAKAIVQSNPQQEQYLWGKAGYVYYAGPNGEALKAALVYPAGYDPSKKYPMIVHIYQSLSSYGAQYTNPNNTHPIGFIITNYALDGYLVLLPDIAYEIGKPAQSAAFCVEAAVKQVMDMGIVDAGKIGLIGHSFGGYETNAILTKSGIFAAAVAGAGISDSAGWYFTPSPTFHNSEAWRFEEQQFRMRVPFYKDKIGYLDNSPLFNADAINTPLLLWTGDSDITVPHTQSIAMYYALRRLGKKCTLLIYPGEGHVILDKKNQKDLSLRIKQWLDHYLKDRSGDAWMN